MDEARGPARQENSPAAEEVEKTKELKKQLEQLLRKAAEIEVELSRADGTIKGIPHYSVIEERAHELGKQLSRMVQHRQMSELAARQSLSAKCPTCGRRCGLEVEKRLVKTVDGDTELQELVGHCPACRRSFFPAA